MEALEDKRLQLDEKITALTEDICHIKTVGQGATLRQREEELCTALEDNKKLSIDLDKAKKVRMAAKFTCNNYQIKNSTLYVSWQMNNLEPFLVELCQFYLVKQDYKL